MRKQGRVEEQLDPIVAKLEEESRARSRELESARNRRLLDRMAREMARLMAESMREIDEEDDPGKRLAGPLTSIRIVPEQVRVPIGETKAVSVVCNREGLAEDDEVLIELDPPDVVELVDGDTAILGPHRTRRDEGLSTRVRLMGLRADEAIITAKVNGRSDAAMVIGCEPVIEEPPTPPEGLEWEKPRVKVAVNKVKAIQMAAPDSVVQAHGERVALSSDNDDGVVLRTRAVDLDFDEDLGWWTANVRIEGRALGARATLYAELGDETAECKVNVAERDDGVPDLRIEYSDEDPIAFRAYFDPPDPGPDGSQTLKILVRHATVRQILSDDLSGQDSPEWLALLPEIVCDTMVRRLMGRKHPVSEEIDSATLYRDHADWHLRLLPKVQKLVLALAGSDRLGAPAGNGGGRMTHT